MLVRRQYFRILMIAAIMLLIGCAKESAPRSLQSESSTTSNSLNSTLANASTAASASSSSSQNGFWESKTLTDAMTDEVTRQAVLKSQTGDTLTLLLRDHKKIWAFVKLAGTDQFGVNTDLMIRIDSKKPGKWDDSLDKLMKTIGGEPSHTWEWNPSLLGFETGQYATKAGESNVCSFARDVHSAHKIVVRYHANQSTFRDIVFLPRGNQEVIVEALGINLDTCMKKKA